MNRFTYCLFMGIVFTIGGTIFTSMINVFFDEAIEIGRNILMASILAFIYMGGIMCGYGYKD